MNSDNFDVRPGQLLPGHLCYAEQKRSKNGPYLFFKVKLDDSGLILPSNKFPARSMKGLEPKAAIEVSEGFLRYLGYEPYSEDWSNAAVFCEITQYLDKQTRKMRLSCNVFKDKDAYEKAVAERAKKAAEKEALKRAREERFGPLTKKF